MHELGLCDALLKKVDSIVKESDLEGVNSITLQIGSLSGVVAKYMEDCWSAVTDGTEYEGSVMKTVTLNGEAACLDCGEKFEADLKNSSVPNAEAKSLCRCPAETSWYLKLKDTDTILAYKIYMKNARTETGAGIKHV